jgi:hypothetical protein
MMPRVHYEEFDFNLVSFGFNQITLQIWGKESLRDPESPETSGSKVIEHGDRSIKISPGLQAVFVNEETDETLTFSITGAFHTTEENGVETTFSTGRSILGDQADNEVVLAVGRFTYTIYADGTASPLTGNGKEIPLSLLLDPIL